MRVVLDTAVVVSALLFARGRLVFLREAWNHGQISPLGSKQTITELIRVLGYPKFQLRAEEMEIVLAAYLPFVETIEVEVELAGLPQCSDIRDQAFVELAHIGLADALVTGDRALLALRTELDFDILTPGELARRLEVLTRPDVDE